MFLPGSLSLFWEAATFFLSPRGTFHHNLKRPMCTCVSAKTNTLTFLSLLPYVFFFVTCVNCFNGVLVVAHIICAAVSQRLCASGLARAPRQSPIVSAFLPQIARLFSPIDYKHCASCFFHFSAQLLLNQK